MKIEIKKTEDISLIKKPTSELTKTTLEFLSKEPLVNLIFAESESYITPFAVIAVSNSPKQIDAICTGIIKNLKEKSLFHNQIKIDGNGERGWCVIDLSDSFINLITEQAMEKYVLEDIIAGKYI